MPRVLVVYESMFGNTEAVAAAVASGLSSTTNVSIREVASAPRAIPLDIDLLVLGAPTHAFGLSRPSTRQDAAEKATRPVVSQGEGLREWLDAARPGHHGLPVAVFDTRAAHPRLPGSAARAATRRLRRAGFHLVARPESFWVAGVTGPLLDGELDRARRWGEELAIGVAAVPIPDEGVRKGA